MYKLKLKVPCVTAMITTDEIVKVYEVISTMEIICTNEIMELIYTNDEYIDDIISKEEIEDSFLLALFPNNVNIYLS